MQRHPEVEWADVSADFIVMGGYGHSRLREFIPGGVTRELLSSKDTFVDVIFGKAFRVLGHADHEDDDRDPQYVDEDQPFGRALRTNGRRVRG
jgi:hypothetical protein